MVFLLTPPLSPGCAEEVRHLDSENQLLRRKHDKIVEEHAKTLERVDELWKQKWKINWDGVSVQSCVVNWDGAVESHATALN